MVKDRKEIYYIAWDTPREEAKVSIQPIFSHPQGTDVSFRFK
jgi:hypothetical protein